MMVASMMRATGVLLILTGGGLYGATTANEALLCAWSSARNPEVAIRHCTAAIELGGLPSAGLAAVLGRRCVAYGEKRDYARALPDCDRAIQLAPEAALPIYRRGLVRLRSGSTDAAMLDFEQAIFLDPNMAWAYRSRGSVHKKRGQYDQAIQSYGDALRLRPDGLTYYERAWCYMHKGDYDWAKPDFDEAIRLGYGADAYYSRGMCYLQGVYDYSRAKADFDQAIRLKPNYAWSYRSRAWIHGQRAEYDLAIRDYTQALRLAPDALSYNGRGWAYYHKGAYLLALWDFARASWRFWTPLVLLVGLIYVLGRLRKAKKPEAPTDESDESPAADDPEPFIESSDSDEPPADDDSEQLVETPEGPLADPEPPRVSTADTDLNVLIRTGMRDRIAIGLLESLLQQAGIPFFVMDQNAGARQESGNIAGWWNVRVPRERETEAHEIIRAVEQMR